jgi:hypothetical protein
MGFGRIVNRVLRAFDVKLVRAHQTDWLLDELTLGPAAWLETSQSKHLQRVWGYVDRHSIDPGEGFDLMLSAAPDGAEVRGRIEIFRIGYEGDSDRRRVWRSGEIAVSPYRAHRLGLDPKLLDRTASSLGPNWPPALTVEDTGDWTTGYHSIDFVAADGTRDEDVAFIVVTDPARSGDVLLKLATATYQAYNRWGGHSLYDGDDATRPYDRVPRITRGAMVSFDRPTPSEFFEWEYHYVLWLEKLAKEEGFRVAYATNHDVTRDPAFAENYRLFVSFGHDEYWSKEEFDRTYDRIFERGGNTMFLGANTAYWQVRYVDVNAPTNERGRQLVCYKNAHDPICRHVMGNPQLHVTDRFRAAARRPETMLAGVGVQSNLPNRYHGSTCSRCLRAAGKPVPERNSEPRYAYYVEDADHPLLRGTGYTAGERVADVIGHEWDNRDPEAEYPAPGEPRVEDADRLWDEERSEIDPIPLEDIRVLLAGKAVDVLGREGRAEAVYFESPAGAKVFSSGTIRWPWGLGKEGFAEEKFRRLNRNLVLDFLGRETADQR